MHSLIQKYVTNDHFKEHVTIHMYKKNYKFFNYSYKKDYSNLNLSIDNQNNLKNLITSLTLTKNNLKLDEIIKFYEEN